MENQENHVTEQVTEDVGQPTQKTQKTYTQEEVDAMMGKRLARQEAKIRKEYEPHQQLVDVLAAGTGETDVGMITGKMRDFYAGSGKNIPEASQFSDKDIGILAKADAQEVIGAGYQEVVEEVERLSKLGDKMTAREKAALQVLTQYRQNAERGQELAKLGVAEDVYGSKDFQDFAAQFTPSVPMSAVYELYCKANPQKEIKTMGSMKNTNYGKNTVKDFYSYEEAKTFTKEDFDKNPALFKAVEKSMQKW